MRQSAKEMGVAKKVSLLAAILAYGGSCFQGTPVPENAPPEAKAGMDRTVAIGEQITFDGTYSEDPDGEITAYSWNLGDGTVVEEKIVEHSYDQARRYVVSLTVTDDQDATGRDEVIITVSGGEPVASLSMTPETVHQHETINFDASDSTAQTSITDYRWNFGDGNQESGQVVTHAYQNTGTFRLTLTVTDQDNRSGSTEQFIEVLPVDISGTFDVVASPATFSCNQYTATFTETEVTFGSSQPLTATTPQGHNYSGSLNGSDFSLSASYTATTGGTCSSAPVSATLNGTFDSADSFSGTATAYYDLTVPCQCSALFNISGTRR